MALTKRSVKGSALTNAELDANFTHLGGDGTYQAPSTKGTAGQVLKMNALATSLEFAADTGSDVVADTTPQLGGNLDVQTHSVVSVSNQSISVTPHGSGRVVLDGLNYPSADGSAGEVLKTDGSGNLSFGSAGGGSATAVVANNAGLQALSGNSVGDFAFVTGTNKLYIRNSNGWYLIATVTNATPTISSAGSPTYTFATNGTPVVVTIVATEPEGETITYAYTVSSGSLTNGGGATATVVQGTGGNVNKFTITPTTTKSYAGAFSLTFTAQDPNGNTATSSASAFTLGFDTAGSLYFDGSGDAIIHESNSNFSMGTGDYTIEMWINWTNDSDQSTALSGNEYILDLGGNKSLFKHISGKIRAAFGSSSDYVEFTPSTSEFRGWHHMAMTRQGNVHTFWYDGVNKGQQTVSYTHSTTTLTVGGFDNGTSGGGGYNWGPGYLSNIRIVKGTAVYTSGFTPSTAPLTAISGTVYLIANNTLPSTLSNGSYYFAATDRKLTSSSSTDFTMGASTDFTVEFWYKAEAINTSGYWFDMGSNTFVIQYFSSGSKIGIWNSTFSIQGGTGVGTATNKWFHAVAQRSGGTFQLFIDGVLSGSNGASYNLNQNTITLNNYGGGGSYGQTGYLSDFRVVKGTAVYSGNFTPPNGPLTKTGGSYPSSTNVNTSIPSGHTKLLTAQNSSGGFIDNSDSAHTLTPGGTVTQENGVVIDTTDVSSIGHNLTFEGNVAFSYATPFLSGGGGSIQFDGGAGATADWISGTVVGPGASDDFTLEMWIKPTSNNPSPYAQNGMVQIRPTAMGTTGDFNGLGFAYRGGGTGNANYNQWKMMAGTTFSLTYDGIQNDALAPSTDSWTHVAQIRTGTVTSLFVDGKGVIKLEGDNNSYATSTHLGLGAWYSTSEAVMNGNISNFRYIIGSSPYTISNGTGGSSNFPNGGSDALLAASLPALGADDWTIEFYVKLSHTFTMGFIQVGKDNGSLSIYLNGSNRVVVEGNQTGAGYSSATQITTNGWHHIAVVNDGTANTQTTYINGAADANTGSRSTAYTYTEDTVIIGGRWYTGAIRNTHYRYISNVRITKAKVYTGNFIVPFSPLTAITNCQLLTCQNSSGAITDASTNNLTITSPGNVAAATGTAYHPATGIHPFIGQITPPTTALSAITNTKLLTANQSNAINDDSTSNVSLTINGTGAIATKQNPF